VLKGACQPCTIARFAPNPKDRTVIDQLREQIQKRLDELVTEVERLRKALAALDPRAETTAPESTSTARKTRGRGRARSTSAATAAKAPAAKPASQRTPRASAASRRRTAPGSTKAAVLAALADGEAMTAGEVAAKTGLGRGTVSTTLSKLAGSGEVQKAARGYQRATAGKSDKPAAASAGSSS
jgi:DNA-binding transcriptional ArsR family regulator